MVDQSARGQRAVLRIGEGQEIVPHQPDQMRRHGDERGGDGDIGSGRLKRLAGVSIDQDEQRQRDRQHGDEIFRPQRQADRQSEQQPIHRLPAAQRAVEGKAGQRPERQLDDVVVELGGGVVEVVQAVDDEHGRERAQRPDQRPRRAVNQGESRHHRDLRQQVIGKVMTDGHERDLDQPPRQGRQLVVAELPFAAVDQRLDQVERQIGVKQRRQRGPDRGVQGQEGGKGPAGAGGDPGQNGHAAGRRHRLRFQNHSSSCE